jgi:hypothetical protein
MMRLTRTDHEAEKLLQELDGLIGSQSPGHQSNQMAGVTAGDAGGTEAEPPAMVDLAVRNMARRELQQSSPPLAGKLRWLAGLSTASIALIALGISLVQSPKTPIPADTQMNSKGVELESRREESSSLAAPASDDGLTRSIPAQSPQPTPQAEAMRESISKSAGERAAPAMADSLELMQAENPVVDSAKPASAEAWLDLIQQLQDQGLLPEAREQLHSFVGDHPEYPLPDWALALLQEP